VDPLDMGSACHPPARQGNERQTNCVRNMAGDMGPARTQTVEAFGTIMAARTVVDWMYVSTVVEVGVGFFFLEQM
jgi:hypothetical protein